MVVETLISVGIVVAKCAAVALMLLACGAIYLVESRRSADATL